ncbi:1-phosphofructokinase family hexose kinase [Actinomyces urogenitalis]|uniref:1-phosphofructokinase family hexose kinase n=1 Tax=Actinomyces urogenitalis TaxID=103621 RepID=UPI00290898A1|nr:1-phosphofructokinase family hexose kinase [Actinomyces urogenitalis]MDU5427330.1 1-phosphofructokinase family hexose kinase [Actinomyces urogenitalis]
MIVTLTANPSLDRTAQLPTALVRGEVNRVASVTSQAGGKGLNVAWVLAAAGVETTAVVPVGPGPLGPALETLVGPHMRIRQVEVCGATRVNTAITEADGTTTKLNEPGARLSLNEQEAVEEAVVEQASRASVTWVVLSGSLPPGAPQDWYARLIRALRARAPQVRIALDTSDAALEAVAQAWPQAAPDLLKPNGYELGQLAGLSRETAWELEEDAAAGSWAGVLEAAGRLRARGVGRVLASLGAAGAVLVTSEGVWRAQAPQVRVRSTVGAGDSCLAGYLLGQVRGRSEERSLAAAVAYGSAAAALPGTQLPRRQDLLSFLGADPLLSGFSVQDRGFEPA